MMRLWTWWQKRLAKKTKLLHIITCLKSKFILNILLLFLFWVTGHCNRAAVSRNIYGRGGSGAPGTPPKIQRNMIFWRKITWNTPKLCLSSRNMIDKTMCEVLWRNISDFYVNLRVEVGKNPQVIIEMHFFFFILDKNNERPDWMTDLKHIDSTW
jgi:hypothetical protein